MQLAQKLSRANTIQYRYTIRRVTILGIAQDFAGADPHSVAAGDRAGIVSMSYIQDRRDDPIDSHSGYLNTVDLGAAWKGFGSATDYARIVLRNTTYHRIGRDLVLARSTQFGYIERLGGAGRRFLSRSVFFSGGASTNRAFPDNQAGPRDLETGFPLGGNAFLFNNTEIRFPLIGDNVGGVLFHDIGNVYSNINDVSLRFTPAEHPGFQLWGELLRLRHPLPYAHRPHSRGFQPEPEFAALLWVLRHSGPASGRHRQAGQSAHQHISISLLIGADVLIRTLVQVAHALVRAALAPAVSRLFSTPWPAWETGVGTSADAARTSACATSSRVFALLCIPGLLTAGFAAEVLDRIAVTVDKHVIAESDVILYLRVAAFLDRKPVDLSGAAKRTAAAALVDRYLMLEESDDSHFTLPSVDATAALLQQVKAQYPSDAAYQAALREYHINEQDLEKHLLAGMRALRFTDLRFRPEIQISDQELNAAYNKYAAEWRASHSGAPPSFEDNRADLEKLLTDQRASEALDQWLVTARQKRHVEYREAAFQ